MKRILTFVVPALLPAVVLVALSGGARTASSQDGTYIPRPPVSDTILYPETRKDPRVAPHDAHNPLSADPKAPRTDRTVWSNNDYFTIGTDPQATLLIQFVENAHLGPKTNPRGFWSRFNVGAWSLAMSELKYILWVFPNHPRALFLLEAVSRRLNDTTIPVAYYEKALRLYPSHAYTRAQYGAYLVAVGERLQGIMQLEQALKMDPNSLPARAWLDKAKRESGMNDAASEGPTTPAIAPGSSVQRDGMYVPRR